MALSPLKNIFPNPVYKGRKRRQEEQRRTRIKEKIRITANGAVVDLAYKNEFSLIEKIFSPPTGIYDTEVEGQRLLVTSFCTLVTYAIVADN